MKFIEATKLEDAIKIFREKTAPIFKKENVPLSLSLGRAAAEDAISPIDVPGFDKATADGYALRSKDAVGASESIPSFFRPIGEVKTGFSPDFKVGAGDCARIPTGAPLPEGADAVSMLEYSEYSHGVVSVYKPVAKFENVARTGDDLKKNDILIRKGQKIDAFKLGILAGAGIEKISVIGRPTARIISTGDELICGGNLKTGQIYDINAPLLTSLAKEAGLEVTARSLVKDDEEQLTSEIRKPADFVIISGGSSVGDKDFTERAIIDAGGTIYIKGLALKPGKPTILGELGGRVILGLSGNPVSAAVAFIMLFGLFSKREIEAKAGVNFPSSPGAVTFKPVRLEGGLAYPVLGKSGILTTLSESDGFILIPEETEGINKGEILKINFFNSYGS
jgi:molybdenum cofactor synthesis domain